VVIAMRVGIISPNLIDNIDQWNALHDDPRASWPLDSLAKRASLLFDKLYLTEDLEKTFELIGSICSEEFIETLLYLQEQGLILRPQDLGFSSGDDFLNAGLKGVARKLHTQLLQVGNPGNDGNPDDLIYVGQPDIGDWAAQNGMHPRSNKGWDDPAIAVEKQKYESLLLRRNAAILREAGLADVAVVGRLYEERRPTKRDHPVWKVVLNEMPQFDLRAPWEDVLAFRAEPRTQHLIRSLRRWIRKITTEEWTQAELEDEVRELLYEYDAHLRLSRVNGGSGTFSVVITGASELAEDIVKLRFGKIAKIATAVIDQRIRLLEAETTAPGRELALLPELRKTFSH
jgi:hypothetical protein